MKILVLLSQGRHPVSRRAAPVELELQAIGLARRVAWQVVGLHAGPATDMLAECGGYGLDFIHRLDAPPEPGALARIIRALEPDLVLAGRRGMGGNDSGLLPYCVAHALGWPIVADVTSVEASPGGLALEQFRPHGARRHLHRRGPLLATIHPARPPAAAVRVRSQPDNLGQSRFTTAGYRRDVGSRPRGAALPAPAESDPPGPCGGYPRGAGRHRAGSRGGGDTGPARTTRRQDRLRSCRTLAMRGRAASGSGRIGRGGNTRQIPS